MRFLTEHLSFYIKNNVSPVRQDVQNHIKHFERRKNLYKFLGVTSNFLKGKSVIEIGPGSGQNSLYTASCNPLELFLLEPNPSGIKQIKESYKAWPLDHTNPTLINNDFLKFETETKYDFVIAECWLGRTKLGKELIKKIESITKENGIIILTATPNIGLLANTLRAALGYRLINKNNYDFKTQSNILHCAFKSHVETLSDMSRMQIDWVQDNLMNPAALEEIIHPHELINLLKNSELLSSYPFIYESWEWYKSLHSNNSDISKKWIKQYDQKSHNFLDTQTYSNDFFEAQNIELEVISRKINDRVIQIRHHNKADKKLIDLVNQITNIIPESHPHIKNNLKEWLKCYISDEINQNIIQNMKSFKNWFGRELIYMSFIKK